MNKLKVVLSFQIFPMTMALYFWRAFERRKDVELFVAGPFFDDYIPWCYGMRLPKKYVKVPNLPLPPQMAQVKLPSAVIESQLPWTPDLWIQIDSNWHLANKPKAGMVALVEPDPHVLKGWYQYPKSYSDIVFSMQDNYREPDEKYLPYAHDPEMHFPEELPIEHDGCLVGLHYPQRDRLVALLRGMGFNIHYDMAKIYDEYRTAYNKSKIALSWSTLLDTPARVWEAMGMKLPALINRTPDLGHFFVEGDHYLGFDTLEEAGRQFARLIADPVMAEEIAGNAYRKVQYHTYDQRVQALLEACKLV